MVTRRLLDTDTFSYLLIGRQPAAIRARKYVQDVGQFGYADMPPSFTQYFVDKVSLYRMRIS
jgi:hypothetical protein